MLFFFYRLLMVKVKRASFTPPIDVMPPSMGRKNSYTIPVPLEPVTIPTYYSSSITVARWYEVAGFNQEFGLQVQNPEWKMLQGIPCATLLEGAIKHTMNVSCFYFLLFPYFLSFNPCDFMFSLFSSLSCL